MPSLTWQNVDRRLASVDLTQDPVVVNLADVTFLEPFAIVYLGMFLRLHSGQGKRLSVILPEARAPLQYLTTQQFWERFGFKADLSARRGLIRRVNTTSLNDIVDIEPGSLIAEEVGEAVLKMLRARRARVKSEVVAELVVDLVDNFAEHSHGGLGVFMMQCYPGANRVDFAIGDCGIGIRESLSSVTRYEEWASRPHWEIANEAFKAGVTRKPESEGGLGLTDVRDHVIELGGHLVLSTGNGFVQVMDGKTRFGPMAYDLQGVQIELSFPER